MAKKIDPKAKAKRQKIYAAIGGVILLGLLAFQVPRTLKMLHPATDSSSSSSTPAATTPSATTPIAAPSLGGGNVTASVASSAGGDGLVDPDAVPAPTSGQLLSFGLFRTKDPFRQQLDINGPTGAAGVTSGTSGTKTKQPKGPTGATGPKTSGGSTATVPPVRVVPTTAVISLNGSPETVQVGGSFPSSDPVFELVSLTGKTAKVGIAGGSLESGAAAVTLQKNRPVTLLNTADGTRYVLRLLSIS
jgi:hypothetical protein